MLKDNEIRFVEVEIIELLEKIEKKHSEYIRFTEEFGHEYDSIAQQDLAAIEYWIRRLFKSICVYFEAKGLSAYLNQFLKEFSDKMLDSKLILETSHHEEEDYPPTLTMLDEFYLYLNPFKAFSKKITKAEVDNLIDVLKSTPQIIRKTRLTSITEPNIYKDVRWVLDFYYNTRKAPSRFIHKFKEYKPDILIPDMQIAIEYKLVRKKAVIDDYIGQLIVDANTYVNDPNYDLFLAVLCLSGSIETERNIRAAWNEKSFPKNWELVVVHL